MRERLPILLVAFLAGCERAPLPLDLSGERLMVHSVLVAGRDMVHVLVERVDPSGSGDPGGPEGNIEVLPVMGADVEMVVEGRTIQLMEAAEDLPPCASAFPYPVPQPEPTGPGCYAARLPQELAAGNRYSLVVRIGGEAVARGDAVVPDYPRLTTPTAGAQYDVVMGVSFEGDAVPGILLRYRLPDRVAGIRTSIAFDSIFDDGARVAGATCSYDQFVNFPERRAAGVDSLVFVPRGLFCFREAPQGGAEVFVPDSIFSRLSLAAFDSTYMRYDEAARQQSAELGRLQAGVEGALGLFAGVSVTRVPIVLVPTGEIR